MNKLILIAALVAAVSGPTFAKGGSGGHGSHHVGGYTRSDGTYVAPHYQTNPNATKMDNWSTKGNSNPYTGKEGTVDPYRTTPYNGMNNTRPPRTGSGCSSGLLGCD
jgi:hypothetical protein